LHEAALKIVVAKGVVNSEQMRFTLDI
jgi:hypothetical protein